VHTTDVCRFLSKDLAEKYGIDVPPYQGIDQVVEVFPQEEKTVIFSKNAGGPG
jgi:hypothetical protein